MKTELLNIKNIPGILYGEQCEHVYIYVHGKSAAKEEAYRFARKAVSENCQVLSFDLPEHGARRNEPYPCDVWNGVHDLEIIGEYARNNWKHISLYACSLGAYFSLLAYKDYHFKKCLFVSPVLNMEHLIENMMKWSDISEKDLLEQREICTPMGETLSWDYYCYTREHPVTHWAAPTSILYGSDDNLTEREIVDNFTNQFRCDLSILENGEHWFHTEEQLAFLDRWIEKNIAQRSA